MEEKENPMKCVRSKGQENDVFRTSNENGRRWVESGQYEYAGKLDWKTSVVAGTQAPYLNRSDEALGSTGVSTKVPTCSAEAAILRRNTRKV